MIQIDGQPVGPGYPPLLVAEIGNNHGGDPTKAENMVRAAAKAGARAIKLQTYHTPHFLSSRSEFFRDFEAERLDYEAQAKIFTLAESLELIALSTPFDLLSLDFLIQSGRPAIKIASGDITFPNLLHAAGRSGLPVILSTGASSSKEVEQALNVLEQGGTKDVILLHCTANYPADPAQVNLHALDMLRKRFGKPVGFSDHTEGIDVALGAVAMGAVLIEKHFTTNRTFPGGDNDMSILPAELEALALGIRRVHDALGVADKRAVSSELPLVPLIRRSPHAIAPIRAGDLFTSENIALVRPGDSLPPETYDHFLGKRASANIPQGAPLTLNMII